MAITLKQFIVNLKQLDKDFPEVIRGLLEDKSSEFIKANIDSWNKGLNPNTNEQLTNTFTGSSNYSLGWSATRKEKGLPYDHFYLQYSGDMAERIYFDIKVKKNEVTGDLLLPPGVMYEKGNDLYKMFGDFLGVPNKYSTIFVEWFRKELKFEVEKRLFAS